ncbi:ABC transporter permease [Corynebacterium silvaticum]|uniref:ABC transporter permease n=1 Tax=Corynebacterium silvaticum TaxID=2320431 RepID=A0ACD4PYS0_9CORY|nr:ABC transporter permease [Corynebacterium silvaticum]WCV10625.1 ABC transporter permease [Corynebacterium silvaticum]
MSNNIPLSVNPAHLIPPRGSSRWRRYKALAQAEIRQYLRNKTLLFMAVVFPIGVGFLMQFLGSGDTPTRIKTAISMEVFFLITLMFVQFYAVLSMTTTRRDERVLKRLRTGETQTPEILAALATPGAIISLSLTGLMLIMLIWYTNAVPYTVFILFIAINLGIVISTAFALLTSAITSTAEAAQLTSLPVMVLAMLSQSSLRAAMPNEFKMF